MPDNSTQYSTNNQFLKAVIDTLNEGVVVQSSEGKVVGFNKKALELLAISADQLTETISDNEKWTAIDLDGNPIPAEKNPIMVTLRTQEPQHNVIMGVPTEDQKLKWLSTNTKIIDINSEKVAVAAFTDITELIELNKNLNEQNKLQLIIQEELEKKISQLQDFAGIITHDVRGPASNIKKLIQVYENKKDDQSSKQAFEYLKQASDDLSNNLNELIKLLQWHLDKKSPFTKCSFDLITDSVLVQLDNIIKQKEPTIYRNFEVDEFEYAKVYLHSIIYNLVSNALKYGRENIPVEIRIETFRKEDRVCLRITDNGRGINLEKFGHTIFKFHRNVDLENASKGIGLYLVQHQVEEFGGTISVSSEPDKGTSFTIVF